ncbi:MAG: DUF3857 domain-containing protein [Flavobacteriaceae bacterium]
MNKIKERFLLHKICVLMLNLGVVWGGLAQGNYDIKLIQEELKENANAVIRDHNTIVEIAALNQMIITEYKALTVLNRFGDQLARVYEYYDESSRSILKLSATILDAKGQVIKKYKKSDFKDVSAVSDGQMYMDDRMKYVKFQPSSYPYTIIFESKVKEKSTTHIGRWVPLEGYYVGLENSTYKLINHTTSKHKFKTYNSDVFDLSLQTKDDELFFVAKNIKAIEREAMSPSFLDIMPWVRVALNEFELEGKYGTCENWKDFGLWQHKELLDQRDLINGNTQRKISELVSNATSKKDKVKRIYEYVQNNTRYVGVQLGIGGWQPIKASEVDRVKYGDCKGLTNYTKALLKSQGIDAYYTIVYLDESKKNIDKDFASLQGNHVILNVPLKDETIWLECTSQTIPFGFVGDSTDDRDVLVVKPSGGEIMHTPIYDELTNVYSARAHIKLDVNGSIAINFSSESKGLQYYYQSYKERLQPEELVKKYLSRWNYLNGLKIIENEISLNKENVIFNENLKMSVSNYATKVGDDLLLPINPFNRLTNSPIKYSDRRLPFKIKRSFSDDDVFEFKIPSGYIIDALPVDYELNTEFGKYKIIVSKLDDNTIRCQRQLVLKEGVFSKEKYELYRTFIKKIKRKDKSKILLTKK